MRTHNLIFVISHDLFTAMALKVKCVEKCNQRRSDDYEIWHAKEWYAFEPLMMHEKNRKKTDIGDSQCHHEENFYR